MALKNFPKGGPLTLTLLAQAAHTGKGPRFVKFHSDNSYFVLCGAAEQAIGILAGSVAVNAPTTIQLPPSISLVELGDTVAAGAAVTSDSVGRAVTAVAGNKVNGWAYTGGAVGELATVKLTDPSDATAVGGTVIAFGITTLVGGAKTVSTTAVKANDKIFLSRMTSGGTPGVLSCATAAIVADTSFAIASTEVTDVSTVAWAIVR